MEANESFKLTCKQDLTYNLAALRPGVNQQSRLVPSSAFSYLTLTVQITPAVESAGCNVTANLGQFTKLKVTESDCNSL